MEANYIDTGLLLLRLAVGGIMTAQGIKNSIFNSKLQALISKQGMRPAPLWAWMCSLSQAIGGLSVLLGLATPIGAALLVAVMVVVLKIKFPNGFWNLQDGIEYPLLLTMASLALAFTGAGAFSLDSSMQLTAAFGNLSLIIGSLVVTVGGAVVSTLTARPDSTTVTD